MKKFLIILLILNLFAVQVFAMTVKSDYMNICFWQKFNDENLVDNLNNVYQNNHDLKAAVLKVNEAQRIVKMSFANELPHIGFEGYIGQIFKSSDEVFGNLRIPDYTETHFLLPLTMNYEIDIWGQNHLKTKSQKKQLEMIMQDERAAYIYISSAFAVNYYNLIRIDKLLEYQKKLISLQNEVIKSYKIRYECGTATLSDIDESEKNLTFMTEDLQKLEERQVILKNQLSLMLADRGFEDIKRTSFDDLVFNIKIPDSISFDTLRKRPDRIKSELDLERIGIDVKIARRDFLPKFIITGDVGFNLYNISSPHNFLADIGVVPVWDIFTGGRKIQMLKMKKDDYNIAVQHYEKSILTSIQETNDALYSIKVANNVQSITEDRLNTDIKEMGYTKIREEAGTADNLDLILQEQRLIISKKQTVSSKINRIISAINLYQAIGGLDFTDMNNL
jgi:outer membrane protein TolC